MRVGLLLCDHVRPGFRSVAGDYPDFFDKLFTTHPELVIDCFDLTAGQFPTDLDDYQGWITSGSRLSVNDDIAWIQQMADLVRTLDRERRKLVGICFGAQMIGHALGGTVGRASQGWQVGIKEVTLESVEPWMVPRIDNFRILHSNADQILIAPDRLRILGSSAEVPISVIAVEEHFVGFQGHPEFVPAYSAVLMEARRGTLIPDAIVEAGLASLALPPHTDLLSDWIASFLKA